MLTQAQPRKKMVYSIENLARSSHDEPNHSESVNFSERADNSVGLSISPCVTPSIYDRYSSVLHNGYYSNPGMYMSPVISSAKYLPTKIQTDFSGPDDASDPGTNDTKKILLPTTAEKGQLKRKRDDSCDSGVESPSPERSRHTSEASFSSNSSYPSDIDDINDDLQKKKKARTAFSSEQINELEKRYQVQKYLPANERNILAAKLKLADQQVKTWFQNRRMKEKRQQRDDEHARSFNLPTGGVDVAQLAALGVPCPPPYSIHSTPVRNQPGMSPSGFMPQHMMPYSRMMQYHSAMNSPVFHAMPTHMSSLPVPASVVSKHSPK